MRVLYTLIFTLLLPVIVLRMLVRSLKAPAYRQRLPERFGLIDPVEPGALWIHAVSVGEVIAIAPLVERLLADSQPILITTMTPTGAAQVAQRFGTRVSHRYLPWDLPLFLNSFLARSRPASALIVETELWPNLLAACHQRGLPVLLANARLSARSARGYRRFATLTREAFGALSWVCAQHRDDAERFIGLGLPANRIEVTGSVKFDIEPDTRLVEQGRDWRSAVGESRPVLIAASTHQGEDQILLQSWQQLRRRFPELLLILVPRHPERFAQVYELARHYSERVERRSNSVKPSSDTEIWIGDSLGEMFAYYAASDVAFVGGSFSGTGGHNPLEPAALGIPVLMGPSSFNFKAIVEQLEAEGALLQCADQSELATAIEQILSNPQRHQSMGDAGQRVLQTNRGALDRLEQRVRQCLL